MEKSHLFQATCLLPVALIALVSGQPMWKGKLSLQSPVIAIIQSAGTTADHFLLAEIYIFLLVNH